MNDGTRVSKGEAYGRVPAEDLKIAGEYLSACASAAKNGLRFPSPPTSMNGLAQNFFTDMKLCSQPMQHTDSAANFNRQCVYAAHNSNGKAQIWLTVSPDDALAYRVVWYAFPASTKTGQSLPGNYLGSSRYRRVIGGGYD
jgi:hypothetical protein